MLGTLGATDSTPRLRQEIQRLQGHAGAAGFDIVRPTAEVKRAIELARRSQAAWARTSWGRTTSSSASWPKVWGSALGPPAELGVTLERVNEVIERLRNNPEQIPDPMPPRRVQPRSAGMEALPTAAQKEAAQEGTGTVLPPHLVKAMAGGLPIRAS